MVQPNWFDTLLVSSGADPKDAAQIAAVIAKSPRILQAIQRGIDAAALHTQEGKLGPGQSQCIRRELSQELQAPG